MWSGLGSGFEKRRGSSLRSSVFCETQARHFRGIPSLPQTARQRWGTLGRGFLRKIYSTARITWLALKAAKASSPVLSCSALTLPFVMMAVRGVPPSSFKITSLFTAPC